MIPMLTIRLCNIALKPGISASTNLITIRRILRNIAQQLDEIQAERRTLRRKAAKLKAGLPFTRHAIEGLELEATQHRERARADGKSILAEFGTSLMFDREGFADALGFERMCDLLGVNPAHRRMAQACGEICLRDIVYMARLEDSSTGYGDDWGAGGPLYRACHAAMVRFIKECPEDQLPDPFEPGAPFSPKLLPQLKVVH